MHTRDGRANVGDMKEEIEPYYQNNAKDFVDSMFDAKLFHERITRDNIQGYEDLLAYLLQSQARSAKKIVEFTNSVKKLQK